MVSFLGILGVLIWFVQPTSQEESEETAKSSSSSAESSSKQQKSDEEKQQQQQQQSDALSQQSKKRKAVRQIDTIFENANETAPTIDDESSSFNKENKLQTQTKTTRTIQQISITTDSSKSSLNDSLSNLIATLTTQQQQQQEKEKTNVRAAEEKKVNDLKLIKVKRSLEDDLEPSADPDDMVDQFLNDLVVDENEKYAYNKEDKKNKSDADLSSIRTGSSNLSNQSRNSLLGI